MNLSGKFSPEYLQPFRAKGDALADGVVSKIKEKDNMAVLRDFFATLTSNESSEHLSYSKFNESIQDDIKEYFNETKELPSWANKELFKQATNIFHIYGPETLMILISYSLPFCYSCANGAQVLYQTGRLNKHDGSYESFSRRLIETAQFVIDVLEDGALLDANKKGLVSIQKVRLIHATIRSYINYKSDSFQPAEGFDADVHGEPINQEDLAGTMLSFSIIILRGLEKLNYNISQKDKEAFVHYWNVVGSMLGVPDELIPANHAEAELLTDSILAHQSAPSNEGTELTLACLGFMQHLVPGERMEKIPLGMMHLFCGDEMTSLLGIPDLEKELKLLGELFLKGFVAFRNRNERDHFLRNLAGNFSRNMIDGLSKLMNVGKGVQFHLPSSLSDFGKPLGFNSKLPTGSEIISVSHAVHLLKEVCNYFKAINHPNGYFAAIYYLVTRMVEKGIEEEKFNDIETLEKVDIAFVSRYFEALNHYFNEEEPTTPWKKSFEACEDDGLFIDQYIFIAINAHMNYDLAYVVSDVCGDNLHSFKSDFDAMNDLFGLMYPQMNTDVGAVLRIFEFFYQKQEEAIIEFEQKIVAMSRGMAWARAIELSKLKGERHDDMTERFENRVLSLADKIYYPGKMLDNILRRFAKREKGSVADKIDVLLRTDLLDEIND